jgi:cytosine/adenosine deaminase-related metal-dependent hydrolase
VVLPVGKAPILNGAVIISGQEIACVGRWTALSRQFPGQSIDLGEVILLPGLVNAHCHLDYTNMVGQFPPPKLFSDWLKMITTTKGQLSYSEFAESWLEGSKMLVRNGVTTVGDVETVPELFPEVLQATPLRVISFLEMTGIRSRRDPNSILQEAADRIESLSSLGFSGGLSPHAPYSTRPELLRLSARLARKRKWLMTIHVSESAQEFEMFNKGKGEMFEWLRRSQRDMSDCGKNSPVQHLERCGALGKNLLAIHMNYLAKGDLPLLARRKVTIVHCPQSHSYFGHQPFDYRKMARAGLNICLGTDSLASVYQRRRQAVELNLFEEMRVFARNQSSVSPKTILEMVTLNAARGLGLKGKAGELQQNAFADLIALPFEGKQTDIHEAVLGHTGPVAASMIRGKWAIEPLMQPSTAASEHSFNE